MTRLDPSPKADLSKALIGGKAQQPDLNQEQQFSLAIRDRAAVVEALISRLAVAETILLDQQLQPCGRGDRALITIKKGNNGEVTVWNGLPSLNSTAIDVAGERSTLETAVPVRAGQIFYLSDFRYVIPLAVDEENGDQLSKEILKLQVGQSLYIGRASFKDLPDKVSRYHCTLKRVEDVFDQNGLRTSLYYLIDGVQSEQRVEIDSPPNGFEELEGKAVLGPGRLIKLGPSGLVVEIPDALEGYNASEAVRGQVSIEESLAEFNVNSISFRNSLDSDQRLFKISPAKLQALSRHIYDGICLIRDQRYQEAKRHFEDAKVLESCGFRLLEGNYFGVHVEQITGKVVETIIQRIAARSWFEPAAMVVSPSCGFISKVKGALDSHEQELLGEFWRESALIYAEEWLHALQGGFGKLVSKKGELITALPQDDQDLYFSPVEFDVAEFFKEQRIPLSKMFKDRYNRQLALDLLKSYSSTQEKEKIRSLLALCNPGDKVVFGLNPQITSPRSYPFKISRTTPDLPSELQIIRLLYLPRQVATTHAEVSILGAGRYKVEPCNSNQVKGTVFFRDHSGIWREISAAESKKRIFHSGQAIRLGASFQFKLA